jgi:hypothetical protein
MKFMVHHAMVGSACEDGVKLTITFHLELGQFQLVLYRIIKVVGALSLGLLRVPQ